MVTVTAVGMLVVVVVVVVVVAVVWCDGVNQIVIGCVNISH